jgi:hypothetical protein
MARHFAHLFIRDPLVVYKSLLEQDDSKSTLHFEVRQPANCLCWLLSRCVLWCTAVFARTCH